VSGLVVRTGTGTVSPLVSPLAAFLISNALGPFGLPLENIKQPNTVRLRTKWYIHAQDLLGRLPVAYPYGILPSALRMVINLGYMQRAWTAQQQFRDGEIHGRDLCVRRQEHSFRRRRYLLSKSGDSNSTNSIVPLPCHDQPPTSGSSGLSVEDH